MLDWKYDEPEIVERIRSSPADFKILLKTRNEKELIRDWIRHHGDIVGLENLIIADNCSSDSDVLATYQEHSDRLLIFRYSDKQHHNLVHDRNAYSGLYGALAMSCNRYMFLDTDEFLVWSDGVKWESGNSIRERVVQCDANNFIAGCWLHNRVGSRCDFYSGIGSAVLKRGLRWGKPIVPSCFKSSGWLIHNIQYSRKPDVSWHKGAGLFFLLHLTKLYPDQRIRVNIAKLARRGVCDDSSTGENVAELRPEAYKDHTTRRLISEIRECILIKGQAIEAGALEKEHYIRFKTGGFVEGPKFQQVSEFGLLIAKFGSRMDDILDQEFIKDDE